jgi:bifunctional ADP-heptose synthase (sugar kinase/adenylyltransferase)
LCPYNIPMSRFKSIISKFNRQHILVVGDVILDRYIRGSVSRISPEAPVPVVLEEDFFYTPGGAANVAHNIAA